MQKYCAEMEKGTDAIYKAEFGDEGWVAAKIAQERRFLALAAQGAERRARILERRREREERDAKLKREMFTGPPGGVYLDDIDPRF